MTEYKIKYEIELNATDALTAAIEVEKILNGQAYRPYLEVTDIKTGKVENIDLEEFNIDSDNYKF